MSETKVICGPVRLSFVAVWEPKTAPGGDKAKYSVSVIIPKTEKKMIKMINNAIEAAITSEMGVRRLGQNPKREKLKLPLRDGDEEREEDPAYENCMFFTASSETQPGVLDKKAQPVLDKSKVYSGVFANISLNFFAFPKEGTPGNKGIAAGLNNLMVLGYGDALGGGRVDASVDFKGFGQEDDEDDFKGFRQEDDEDKL